MQEYPDRIPDVDRLFTTSRPAIAYRFIDGPGEPVLFLHGVGSSASTWNELFAGLGGRFTIIAPDYRGHGFSEAPPVPYELDDFVDDQLRLLDELGIESVHVVGFSIGAIFAQALALAEPRRVRSLVLLSTIGDRTPAEQQRAFERFETIRTADLPDLAAASA